jgi:hypothetical protein
MRERDRPSRAPYLSFESPQPPARAPLLVPDAPPDTPPLSRRDRWIGYAIFSGLLFALAVAAAVLIHPPLIVEVRPLLPLLATTGFASTAGGYWWLWRRPR